MVQAPKYSLVLPAYKGKFLGEAIGSILAQTLDGFELIVVDDCSPDNLKGIVDGFADNRITFYRNEENIGGKNLVKQWNKCLEYAKGEYVILASDDDVYEKTYLEEINKLSKAYPDAGVLKTRIRHIDESGSPMYEELPISDSFISQIDYLNKYANGEIMTGIPQYTFKRIDLLNIGGFVDYPLAWHSDDATVLKMAVNGIACSNEVGFSFRESGINISCKRDTVSQTEQKIDASISFLKYVKDFLSKIDVKNSDDLMDAIATHSRNLLIQPNDFSYFMKSLWYARKKHSEFLPAKWRTRRLAGYIYRLIFKR